MRRSTPFLAAGLVAIVAFAAWLALGARREAPTPPDEAAPDAAATDAEAAALAARGPAAARTPARLDGRIRVLVLDSEGKPAGHVRVTAVRIGPAPDPNDPATWGSADAWRRRAVAEIDAPRPQERPDAEGATDEAGRCEVPAGRAGQYAVRAEPAPPRWGTTATVTVSAAEPASPAVLRVGDGTPLRGRVVDAQDRAVAAVLSGSWPVSGTDEGWSSPRIATDPATGAFAWEAVPSGKGAVDVTVPGRLRFSVGVVTPRPEELVIRLGPGGVVRGRVTDGAGAPVEAADVLVNVDASAASESTARGVTARARTGADGTYRMEEVPPGPVRTVTVGAPGFLPRTEQAARARWAGAAVAVGKETVLDLDLDRGSVVEGRVVEEGTGAPIAGARVHAFVARGRWADRPNPVASDAQGRFRFEGLAVGRYVLGATDDTHYFASFAAGPQVGMVDGQPQLADAVVAVVAKEGDRLEREIRMMPGLSVRGRVVGPDGAPVEGAKVSCAQFQPWNALWRWGVEQSALPGAGGTSGADGAFRLTGLPPGEAATLTASRPPFTAPPSPPFRLAAGEPEPDVLLRMEPGSTVTGRALDADGAPLAAVQIQWWSMDPSRGGNGNARSEADGTYRLEGLPPAQVQLSAWAQGQSATEQVTPALAPAEVRAGVDLRFRRAARISGLVVDDRGAPLERIRLVAAPDGGSGQFGAAVSRADGTFEIANVPEGEYSVGVNPASGENTLVAPTDGVRVTAPAEGVRVVAKRRLETLVAGRVLLPDGGPVPLCTVKVPTGSGAHSPYGSGNLDEVVGGEFRRTVDGAPPFRLVVSDACGTDGRRLNLQPKEVTVEKEATDLVIRLEAGLAVAGRVVDGGGAGIAGARVAVGPSLAVTDASGAFRVEGLAEGDVTVRVSPPTGFAPPSPRTVRAGTTDVVVPCAAGSAISGRVLGPDGEPIESGSVVASWTGGGANGSIGAGGAFRIEGLPVDAVADLSTFVWDAALQQQRRPARRIGVRAGTEGVELRVPAGASVSGVVVRADGRSTRGLQVTARDADGSSSAAAIDADGRFTVGGLAPGPVRLSVMDTSPWRRVAPEAQVDAPTTGVRLVVPARATLAGRIEGDGVAGFIVVARPAERTGPSEPVASAQVGADGRFSLEVWEGTPFTLGARKRDDDRLALRTPVRAGADVTLTLEPGLSIEGSLARADGKPVPKGYVRATGAEWSADATVAEDGTWRVRGLVKGSYRLSTSLGEVVPETTVEAGATGVRLEVAR